MTRILAIDAGSERTGYLALEYASPLLPLRECRVVYHGKDENANVLSMLRAYGDELAIGNPAPIDVVVFEMMSPRGMPVSRQEMETLVWIGRFLEAASARGLRVDRLERERIKRHLIGSERPKGGPNADSRIRAVLIDGFGGIGGKEAAIGRKAAPGPLYGIHADEWAALAVAVAWGDLNG